jgi:hypothetical protein
VKNEEFTIIAHFIESAIGLTFYMLFVHYYVNGRVDKHKINDL